MEADLVKGQCRSRAGTCFRGRTSTRNIGFLSLGACSREDPGDLYQASGIQLCGTLLDLCASPVAQTARHRGHVLAPRGGTSEPAITQAKFALDTQYMP
jgi:hypothetical protein